MRSAHDHGAADGFLAVQVERTTPKVAADLHGGDVLQVNRRAFHGLHRDEFEVFDTGDEADAAQHKLGSIFLHHLAADIEIRALHRCHHVHERDIDRTHLGGVQLHLILLHKAADARHLGHALHAGELVAHIPVLQRAQLREVIAAVLRLGGIDMEVVLIHPAEAGGIGA